MTPPYIPTKEVPEVTWLPNIQDIFSYDPITGIAAWKIAPHPTIPVGTPITSIRSDGYLRAQHQGQEYAVHRLAFRLMTGRLPARFIDHRNGDIRDNRWVNLREATPRQNVINRRVIRTGLKGVTIHRSGKFMAQCKLRGQNHYLGLFDTEQEAHQAYMAKATELFGDFARAA